MCVDCRRFFLIKKPPTTLGLQTINTADLLQIVIRHALKKSSVVKRTSKALRGDMGRVLSIKDSVVIIEGLENVKLNELLEFRIRKDSKGNRLVGVALNLEHNVVKALCFVMKKFYVREFVYNVLAVLLVLQFILKF